MRLELLLQVSSHFHAGVTIYLGRVSVASKENSLLGNHVLNSHEILQVLNFKICYKKRGRSGECRIG